MTDDPAPRITLEPFDGPEAQALVAEAEAELRQRYGPTPAEPMPELAAEFPFRPLKVGDFTPPVGAFFVAWVDGQAVGCAGLRPHLAETAEVKRVYVRDAHRQTGVARRLMAAVEATARELEYNLLVLETGDAQPEAIALYTTSGWTRIDSYFGLPRHDQSIYFKKALGPAG